MRYQRIHRIRACKHHVRTDRERVLGVADDVLCRRPSNSTAAEKEDLLGRRPGECGRAELGADVLAFSQKCAGKFGKNESSLVDFGIVVARVRDSTDGCGQIAAGLLRGDHEADLSRGVGGNSGERVLGHREESASSREELLDEREVQPEALALSGDVAARGEGVAEELKVRLLEERSGGANGVRGVGDNHVVGGGVIGEELEAVADKDGNAGIGKEGGHVGKVRLGHPYDCLRYSEMVRAVK